MKVFLSWSGTTSHKVALIFRDWLPSVIQSIVPYVSSEDIDKGARWSTDIAKELADSTFGILCVTRDNIGAAWLNFEAGALSKTMDKSLVIPFLFDIKRSEVDGPILQFQSTIFDVEDLKKLIKTLNKACDKDALTQERLERAFDVWYPSLEDKLKSLLITIGEKPNEETESVVQPRREQEILEEILDLSRNNQKLLRSPEVALGPNIESLKVSIEKLIEENVQRHHELALVRKNRHFYPEMVHEIAHAIPEKRFVVPILLGLLRDDMPWIYDLGIETLRILRSSKRKEIKQDAVYKFLQLLDFTFEHPIMRDAYRSRDARWIGRELHRELERVLLVEAEG